MDLNLDVLSLIFAKCDFPTIKTILISNSVLRELILKNRRNYARYLVSSIIVCFEFSDSQEPWTINILNKQKKLKAVPLKIAHYLKHVQPNKLEIYLNKENVETEFTNNYLNYFPNDWFLEIKKIIIISNADFTQNVAEIIRKFKNIYSLEVDGCAISENVGNIIDQMPIINELCLLLFTEANPKVTSCDDDLKKLVEKGKKLSILILNNVNNEYTSNEFVNFLETANFDKNCKISLKNWVDEPRKLVEWIYKNTTSTLSCYRPNESPIHFNSFFPHSYEFNYRNSQFCLTFEENALNGSVFAMVDQYQEEPEENLNI